MLFVKIISEVLLVLLYCVLNYSSNIKKVKGESNRNININIVNKNSIGESEYNLIDYSDIFRVSSNVFNQEYVNLSDPSLLFKSINCTFDKILLNSDFVNEFLFYKEENNEPKTGKRIYRINTENVSFIFDEFKKNKNFCVFENCIFKISGNKNANIKECFCVNERIVCDLDGKKFFENGFYLKSFNDSWDYGYKNENGYVYSLKPSYFRKDLINESSSYYNDIKYGLHISCEAKSLISRVSEVLSNKYKTKTEYDYSLENKLNEDVGNLFDQVKSFLSLSENCTTCTKLINNNIKNWSQKSKFIKYVKDNKSGKLKEEPIKFSDLNGDEIKEKFKYRFLVDYIYAFDKFCRLGRCKTCNKCRKCTECKKCKKCKNSTEYKMCAKCTKCEECEKYRYSISDKICFSFLSDIFAKYFYIFDLNCYKDTELENFFINKDLSNTRNDLKTYFLSKKDKSTIKDLLGNYFINHTNRKINTPDIYSDILFLFKYDFLWNFFCKKSNGIYIPENSFRHVDACFTGVHFTLTPADKIYNFYAMNIESFIGKIIEKKLVYDLNVLCRLRFALEYTDTFLQKKSNKKKFQFNLIYLFNPDELFVYNIIRSTQNSSQLNSFTNECYEKYFLNGEKDLLKKSHLEVFDPKKKNTYVKIVDLDKIKNSFTEIDFYELKNLIIEENLCSEKSLDMLDSLHIKSDAIRNSYELFFFFNINDTKGKCKRNSSFSIKDNIFRLTYQNGNNLQMYNFFHPNVNNIISNNEIIFNDKKDTNISNNEIIFNDKKDTIISNNEIIFDNKKDTKNIMSTFYDFKIDTIHNMCKYGYYNYFCKHDFLSIFALFSNWDYNYANLSVCKCVNARPLIALKRDKMFVYGRLKENNDDIKTQDYLYNYILSILSKTDYLYYPIVDIISSKYFFTVVCDSKLFFINEFENCCKIYYKCGDEYIDISDNNLNFIIDCKANIRNSEKSINCRLIYNPDKEILNCDYVTYIEKNKESHKKKFDIFELLELIDKRSMIDIKKQISSMCDKYSTIRNVAKQFTKKEENFEGINMHEFKNFIKCNNNIKSTNIYSKSELKIIDEIKLNDEISHDSLIMFLWMYCNVDVDVVIADINYKYAVSKLCKKNIIFTDSLKSKCNIKIDRDSFLPNIKMYEIVDNFTCNEYDIDQLYYYLILLSSGYNCFTHKEKLLGNLEGFYHFTIGNKLRLYFTLYEDSVFVLNYIGHLRNKDEMSKKTGK